MPAASPQRLPRKDAVRNRALLVEAAATAFREGGLGVSVNAIARDAGVNIATLYRHFPTKDHLVAAVLEAVLEPLAAARDHALAAEDDARQLPARGGPAAGLAEGPGRRARPHDVRARLREPAIELVTPVVERAHRDGELRADFGAQDLLIALRMVAVLGRRARRSRTATSTSSCAACGRISAGASTCSSAIVVAPMTPARAPARAGVISSSIVASVPASR